MRSFLSFLITFQIAFSYPAIALEVKLKSALNFRKVNEDFGYSTLSRMQYIANLPAGTVLQIDPSYEVKGPNGQININATISKWLAEGEQVLRSENYHDLTRDSLSRANFFPIKIKSIPERYLRDPNHSNLRDLEGHIGYMALDVLARKGDLELVNTEASDVLFTSEVGKTIEETAQKRQQQAQTEATVCENCVEESNEAPQFIRSLKSDLQSVLQQAARRGERNLAVRPLDQVIRNFERNCFGVKFDDFKKYVQEKSVQHGVPAEIMLGIMTQETAQKSCVSIGDKEASGHASVGLFQINTKTKPGIPLCNNSQIAELRRKASLKEMESGPRCMQNPALNTQFGFEVLIAKFKTVNNGKTPTYDGKGWANQSNEFKDEFRRAISAYNGGERWVLAADEDLKTIAEKYGMPTDPAFLKTWEFTRLVAFRRQLEANTDIYNKYGLTPQGRNSRKAENNLINMSYVDAVTGRNKPGLPYTDLATLWGEQLGLTRRK